MGDLNQTDSTQYVSIADEETGLTASVILEDGVKKVISKSDVTVNSLRGFDDTVDWWGWIGTESDTGGVGGAGDIVTWAAVAGSDPTLFPAISVDTTVQAGDDEDDLIDRIIVNLNNDANFSQYYEASKIFLLSPTLYVTAKERGRVYERPNANDISFTATGTTVTTPAFQDLIQRQKNTSLARDPNNPTLGILGISGSVFFTAASAENVYEKFAMDGGTTDLNVDGSVTPVDFYINSIADLDINLIDLKFFGSGSNIKYDQFLNLNSVLTNGIEVSGQTKGNPFTYTLIKSTNGFHGTWSSGNGFHLQVQQGNDFFDAEKILSQPIILKKTGSFVGGDDFIRVRIQDDLRQVASLFFFVTGFVS